MLDSTLVSPVTLSFSTVISTEYMAAFIIVDPPGLRTGVDVRFSFGVPNGVC